MIQHDRKKLPPRIYPKKVYSPQADLYMQQYLQSAAVARRGHAPLKLLLAAVFLIAALLLKCLLA